MPPISWALVMPWTNGILCSRKDIAAQYSWLHRLSSNFGRKAVSSSTPPVRVKASSVSPLMISGPSGVPPAS